MPGVDVALVSLVGLVLVKREFDAQDGRVLEPPAPGQGTGRCIPWRIARTARVTGRNRSDHERRRADAQMMPIPGGMRREGMGSEGNEQKLEVLSFRALE